MSARGSWRRLALGFALVKAGAASAQAPVFRSEVAAVYLDVFVTHSGRPVPGLRAPDFELKDQGVVQRLELLSAETHPLLSVLVFDTSSSMAGDRLTALRAAGEAFLDGLRPGDQASLMTFSEEIAWRAAPPADPASVRAALARLTASGATSAFDALFAGITLTDTGRRPLVVLFTDGEDNLSWLGERQVRRIAERSNALVHVVGWQPPSQLVAPGQPLPSSNDSEHERALKQIAEATGGRFWRALSPAKLQDAFAAIADAMGHRYVLRYEPNGVKREGWHRLDVRLRHAKGDVQARRGYWVGKD